MYFEGGKSMPDVARFLGCAPSTIHTYVHLFVDIDTDIDDYAVAREIIDSMGTPLYATHW